MSAGGYVDVCKFLPTAGGLTDFTFSTAVTGYQSPASAVVVNGTVYSYRAESTDLTQWEIGFGAYNTGTGVLARTTVNASSTGAKVNFSVAPQVSITALTADLQNAALLTGGTLPVARINGGTANQFVQGDGTFQLQGRKLLNTLTAAASATLSDTTSFTSTFSDYELVFDNLLPATNAVTLQLQVNTGGGVQSTVYVATSFNGDAAYGTVQFTNCIPCSENGNAINTAGPGVSGRITAFKFNTGGTLATQWRGDFVHLISATRMGFCSGVGYWNSTTALTGVTISFSAGNITSGTVKIYGIG